jgi:hypothetical protein
MAVVNGESRPAGISNVERKPGILEHIMDRPGVGCRRRHPTAHDCDNFPTPSLDWSGLERQSSSPYNSRACEVSSASPKKSKHLSTLHVKTREWKARTSAFL